MGTKTEFCLNHNPVQHRDTLPPWCHNCYRDAGGTHRDDLRAASDFNLPPRPVPMDTYEIDGIIYFVTAGRVLPKDWRLSDIKRMAVYAIDVEAGAVVKNRFGPTTAHAAKRQERSGFTRRGW